MTIAGIVGPHSAAYTGARPLYQPTTRVLTVLELLQARGRIGGPELAARLEVDRRTVRRYITSLQDLGIPVEAERGRHGGYRLRPGFKLPPLMFTDDEALAITLGLLAARQLGLGSATPAVEGALAKLDRVLPAALRERTLAVQETLVLNLRPAEFPPLNGTVIALSVAARARRRVRLRYRAEGGAETARTIDPYGVVFHAGFWYAVAHCHLRDGIRTFRLDRIAGAESEPEEGAFTRPPDFDSLAFLLSAQEAIPRALPVAITLRTTPQRAAQLLPATLRDLTPTTGGVLLRGTTDNPDWLARTLAVLDIPLVIHDPPELRAALRRLAARLAQIAVEETASPAEREGG